MNFEFLEKYSINLNKKIFNKKEFVLIGRLSELRSLEVTLLRYNKCNPVLIGKAGVGKSHIVQGLVYNILQKKASYRLQKTIIYELDLCALYAGASYVGEAEKRINGLLNEVISFNQKQKELKSLIEIILFVDEIHSIKKQSNNSTVDLANTLKPHIASNDLKIIGATTLEEYREYIEPDNALDRRFNLIHIAEPTKQECLNIARGWIPNYEGHYGLSINDDAISAAVNLPKKYFPTRNFPDITLDLIDDSLAYLQLNVETKPDTIVKLDADIFNYQIELNVQQKEKNTTKINQIKEHLSKLKNKLEIEQDKWRSDLKTINEIKKVQDDLLSIREEEHQYLIGESDYNKFIESKNKQAKLNDKLLKLQEQAKKLHFIKNTIYKQDIYNTIARILHIDPTHLIGESGDNQKILEMPKILKKHIKGQNNIIDDFSAMLTTTLMGIRINEKPLICAFFAGITGTGKTELARQISYFLFGDKNPMLEFNMSEYSESYNVSSLLGSSKGYVGYNESSPLVEPIKRQPNKVILFDEIEKAHENIYQIFLQMMDSGKLVDRNNSTAIFRETIVIFTSNIGQHHLMSLNDNSSKEEIQIAKNKVHQDIINYFKPEFINRLDKIYIFNPLSNKELIKILDISLEKSKKIIQNLYEVTYSCSDAVKIKILNLVKETKLGAREIQRKVKEIIHIPLSQTILNNLQNNLPIKNNYICDLSDNGSVIFRIV